MLNSKNIFLLDGIGAVFSLLLTGFLLPVFSSVIGISTTTLYCLAVFPTVYGLFSFCCYQISKEQKSWMLLVIMVANIFYGFVSVASVIFYEGMTAWGRSLLLMETVAIAAVVAIEWRTYRKYFPALSSKAHQR